MKKIFGIIVCILSIGLLVTSAIVETHSLSFLQSSILIIILGSSSIVFAKLFDNCDIDDL